MWNNGKNTWRSNLKTTHASTDSFGCNRSHRLKVTTYEYHCISYRGFILLTTPVLWHSITLHCAVVWPANQAPPRLCHNPLWLKTDWLQTAAQQVIYNLPFWLSFSLCDGQQCWHMQISANSLTKGAGESPNHIRQSGKIYMQRQHSIIHGACSHLGLKCVSKQLGVRQFSPGINIRLQWPVVIGSNLYMYITGTKRHNVFYTEVPWCVTFAKFTRRPE